MVDHALCTWLELILFFLIGNRNFIEKMNIVFVMMNTLDMKKIQKAQELTANS